MNWYRITPCPNYAISEDGQSVKNITTDQLLNHNVAPYAKDGLRRVTLRRKSVYHNKVRSAPKVYTLESLKEYIKIENLITGTDSDGGVVGELGDDGLKVLNKL